MNKTYPSVKIENSVDLYRICIIILLFAFSISVSFVQAQRVRFVCNEGRGKKDGSSWENASPDLHKMINISKPNDQVWVAGNFDKPTEYTRVVGRDKYSGVQSYLMKMCTFKDENPTSYIFMDPHRPVRIPKYSFQVAHSKSRNNPPMYLVLQIV